MIVFFYNARKKRYKRHIISEEKPVKKTSIEQRNVIVRVSRCISYRETQRDPSKSVVKRALYHLIKG